MIAVIDYGMGNLRSVWQALIKSAPDHKVIVTANPDELLAAERVVFPGQGAMPDCMRELEARGLKAAILEAARTKPFLGICLGLQMLFETSEEGNVAGLSLLKGKVVRFAPENMRSSLGEKLKVPHMGWNQVTQKQAHPLWKDIPDNSRFYFVHSYFVESFTPETVIGTTDYPSPFTSVVAQDNILALQCHPEKSAEVGLKLLRNFVAWKP